MTTRFAKDTDVPVEKTRWELERLLERYEASATAVFTSMDSSAVVFEMRGRRIKFVMPMPDPKQRQFTHRIQGSAGEIERKPADALASWQKAGRRKWRALLLSIKAKLVSVDEGIESFEDAFMAHVVMPDGSTVGEQVRPRIESSYKGGKMVPLLPAPEARQ